ncbi:MAG TPA: hypothetical protein VFI24_07775 [Pyrinomonadaceae bacterium]|nr:hypothetical protein [Pyrinomonadaceae bacterium]
MKKTTGPKKGSRVTALPLTVEQFGQYLCPDGWDQPEFLTWPPDVFALVGSLLLKSGAYARAVSGWKRNRPLEEWTKWLATVGDSWRNNLSSPPREVRDWHHTLIKKETRTLPVPEIFNQKEVYNALLHLCAAADEACKGVGFGMSKREQFLLDASLRLFLTGERDGVSTLCDRIDHATVRVLPKLHTPQSGITIRSLTHNLALVPAGDVQAKWAENPCAARHHFNLLLAPWPLTSTPAHFRSVDLTQAELQEMPSNFGFFEYNPPAGKGSSDPVKRINRLIQKAQTTVSQIHGVILPEAAVSIHEHKRIQAALMKKGIFLICGVREPSRERGKAGVNCLHVDIPVEIPGVGKYVGSHQQSKHHRWFLDKRQIVQYGLGSSLDVRNKWWEHISVDNRVLYFVVLDDWLTICPLICEDLARQDPVSDIVRAVGPNLVLAILMDGPQISSRWPARYATVLADDPGSSVLTLTSLGMCELSRPPGKPVSRAIGLWKDAKNSEAISIEIPGDAEGVVLSLSREFETEWAADGRDDGEATGYPILSGIHPIK